MRILITCPRMLGMIDEFRPLLAAKGLEASCPEVVQTLSKEELVRLVPEHDGWLIGDDPATRRVFAAGKQGRLKAVVKWGIGVDNIDFAAAGELNIPVANTPGMFGREVADLAMSYIVALARETYRIDRGVRAWQWPKPRGISLAGKVAALVGYGDIGKNIARRLLASDMKVIVYDPACAPGVLAENVEVVVWPERIEEADFLVFACALTKDNRHMFDRQLLARIKPGLRIVNVARGPLIDEAALVEGLETSIVHSAALEVFEREPLPVESPLRRYDRCIFGSHNASNTAEAVRHTSQKAMELMLGSLGVR